MDTPDRRPSARFGARRLVLLVCVLALAPGTLRAEDAERDLEPRAPWLFHRDPHPDTRKEVTTLVRTGFGSLNDAIRAREIIVRRYGASAAPVLADEVRIASNEPHLHHSLLTLSVLRDRLGPARELWPPLPHLVLVLEASAEPYRRAFAALALGSYHGAASVPPPPAVRDPLQVRNPEREAKEALERAVQVLENRLRDPHIHVRVAAALALGKMGGVDARRALRPADRLNDAAVEPHQAVLLAAGLLPGAGDEAMFINALRDEDRRIRRAAALAIALQAVSDVPPTWSRNAEPILRALQGDLIRPHLEDGAEAVFCRGVLAARSFISEPATEWRELFRIAVTPSSETEAAIAAAQCLLFCEEPWFPPFALEATQEGAALRAEVLAAFLMRLGSRGTPEGIQVCRSYLRNPGRSPKGSANWNVRFYAALGLLRAIAERRLTDAAQRAEVMEMLSWAARRGLPQGPFQDELARLIDVVRPFVEADPFYTIDEARLRRLERTFVDKDGLLSRDLRDVAVARLNAMVPLVFNVNAIRPGAPGAPNKSEMPQRRLKGTLDAYPYFSRLDLRELRGRRPWPQMTAAENPDRMLER